MSDPSVEQSLMEYGESLLPIFEFAEGQRQQLIARGWTAASADVIARQILVNVLNLIGK